MVLFSSSVNFGFKLTLALGGVPCKIPSLRGVELAVRYSPDCGEGLRDCAWDPGEFPLVLCLLCGLSFFGEG